MSDPIRLVDDDPLAITDELVRAYEAAAGKTLYPAQIERLFIDLIAYRETLVRSLINDVARQNLVAFARAPMLDFLGELVGVTRLSAQPARTTLRFTRPGASVAATLIPAGTLVQAAPGLGFSTVLDAVIPAGLAGRFVDVPAVCDVVGSVGNGFLPGSVSTPLSLLPDGVVATNLAVTSAGAEPEGDKRLRERIRLAPEMFSTAGPRLAYQYAAMAASPLIIDVAAESPTPGVVRLHPLVAAGAPSAEVKALVLAAASAEDVRPLCDAVEVADPVAFPFVAQAEIMLYRDADAVSVLDQVVAAMAAFCERVAGGLGRDVVRSQMAAALSAPGVYRVNIVSPSADIVVPRNGWAYATAQSVMLAGVADG